MWNIIRKDIRVLLNDWKAVLLTFLLPVILVSLFAFAFGGAGIKTKARPLTLLCADQDSSSSSRALMAGLDSIPGMHIKPLGAGPARQHIEQGDQTALLIIRHGFRDSLQHGNKLPLTILYDPSREIEANLIKGLVAGNIMRFALREKISVKIQQNLSGYFSPSDPAMQEILTSKIGEAVRSETSGGKTYTGIALRPVFQEKDKNWGLIQAVAGIAVIMLLFSVTARGSSLLTEHESNTLKRLLIMPVSPYSLIFSKLWYAMILSMVQLIVMFIFAWLVFGLDLMANIPATLLMMIATAFACSTFGMFIASICHSHKQAEIVSIIIILVISTIGGSMIPLYIMPEFMQKMAVFSINYWSIQGFYDIFWREFPVSQVFNDAMVLFLTGIVMIGVSLLFYRKNIHRLIH